MAADAGDAQSPTATIARISLFMAPSPARKDRTIRPDRTREFAALPNTDEIHGLRRRIFAFQVYRFVLPLRMK